MSNIKKLVLVALILALLGLSYAMVIPTNFLAGPNINISRNGTNITITGVATWTLTVLNVSELNVDNVYVSGAVVNPPDEAYEMGWQHTVNTFWMYLYKKENEKLSSVVYSENLIYFYNCYYGTSDCYTHELEISNGSVAVHGDFFVNDKNIETELVKTSVKAYQTTYHNESLIYTDEIIVPQDLNLTNLATTITPVTNSTDYTLNYSVERFTDYAAGTTEVIFSVSLSQQLTYIDDLNFSFNNKDILLLNYTAHINVSKSNTMLKFKVR